MNLPETLTAQYQPWVRSWWLAVWAFAVLLMAVAFYFGLVMGSIVITSLGLMAMAGCAVVLFLVWRDLKTDRDVIRIGPDGYYDARIGELIPWGEISRLVRHQPGTQVTLFIEARAPDRFVKRRYPLYKGAARLDGRLGFPGLASTLSGLDGDAAALIAAAEAWHATARTGV